jgi:hypothetical protein
MSSRSSVAALGSCSPVASWGPPTTRRQADSLAEASLLKAIDLSARLLDPCVLLDTLSAGSRRYDEAPRSSAKLPRSIRRIRRRL